MIEEQVKAIRLRLEQMMVSRTNNHTTHYLIKTSLDLYENVNRSNRAYATPLDIDGAALVVLRVDLEPYIRTVYTELERMPMAQRLDDPDRGYMGYIEAVEGALEFMKVREELLCRH